MAKELPYFQFEPAEYLTKDISFCSLSAQGFFINLCSYYWQRGCNLTKDQFLRRINEPELFNELFSEGVIDLIENDIEIKFLDAQLEKATNLSKTNTLNGKKGGRPKTNKTETKPKQNPIKSETKGIREDNIKEDNINNIYNKFVDEVKNHSFDSRIESMYMRLKLKKGSLTPLLNNFKLHIIEENRIHKNTEEYFINFKNWLNTQDRIGRLNEYKTTKIGAI